MIYSVVDKVVLSSAVNNVFGSTEATDVVGSCLETKRQFFFSVE